MRRTLLVMALALLLALTGLATANAAPAEPSGLSYLLSRQSTASAADWYADGMPAVVSGTVLGAPLAGLCANPVGVVPCGIVAGIPLAAFSLESGTFAKAKRHNACIYVWNPLDNPIPISTGGLNYIAREYNGPKFPNTSAGDRKLTFDDYIALSRG